MIITILCFFSIGLQKNFYAKIRPDASGVCDAGAVCVCVFFFQYSYSMFEVEEVETKMMMILMKRRMWDTKSERERETPKKLSSVFLFVCGFFSGSVSNTITFGFFAFSALENLSLFLVAFFSFKVFDS